LFYRRGPRFNGGMPDLTRRRSRPAGLSMSAMISYESRSGPGFHGRTGFVASWRPIHQSSRAIKVGGSPFETLTEAEEACKAMLGHLTRKLDGNDPSRKDPHWGRLKLARDPMTSLSCAFDPAATAHPPTQNNELTGFPRPHRRDG
jgi:hypothetical protein